MSTAALTVLNPTATTLYRLRDRNAQAQIIIGRYAGNHAWLDVAIGVVGTLIPGAALPAMAACIVAQGPLFYKPMARELAETYLRSPDAQTNRLTNQAWALGAVADVGAELGVEFFKEIAPELLKELGAGALVTLIPIVGGFAGALLDAVVAATLTWRVGTMISMYHQNGGQWVGSRRETYERAKGMVGGLSAETADRVDLDEISETNPEILRGQFERLRSVLLDALLEAASNEEHVVAILRKRGLPEALVRMAVPYIRSVLASRSN